MDLDLFTSIHSHIAECHPQIPIVCNTSGALLGSVLYDMTFSNLIAEYMNYIQREHLSRGVWFEWGPTPIYGECKVILVTR
jgi:hypothetical protein